jgi:hypothetical protein
MNSTELNNLSLDSLPIGVVLDLCDDAWNRFDLHDPHTDTYVSFNLAESGNASVLFVGFRGTQDFENVLTDIDLIKTKWQGKSVAIGFLGAYLSVKQGILQKIQETNPVAVVFVGHSLGASLAMIAHVDSDIVPVSYAYGVGCPRPFGLFTAIKLNKTFKRTSTWYRNDQDIVTHQYPLFMGYGHIGKMIQVGKWWRFWTMFYLDNNNAHMVSSYRRSVLE